MEQPGGQQIGGGFPYGAGPPYSASQAPPRGMMLPNGQPPRPSGPYVSMPQQSPFPAQMSGPPQPPVNGMHMPPSLGQQRPLSQNFPTQGYGPPQPSGPPPKLPLNSSQNNFPMQRPPGPPQQGQNFQPGFGPPSYQNGLHASGPPTPAHIHQQLPRPPAGAYNASPSYPPTSSAQMPPIQGPHSLGSNTPNRGSPLPPTGSVGTTTPRGLGQSPLPPPPLPQQQHPTPLQVPSSQSHPPLPVHPSQTPAMAPAPHMPPQPYMSQPTAISQQPHMPPPMSAATRLAHPTPMPPPTGILGPPSMAQLSSAMPSQQLNEHPGVHQPIPQPGHQHPNMPPMPNQASQNRRPPMPQDQQQSNMTKRYPNQAAYNQPSYVNNTNMDHLSNKMGGMTVTQAGFNKLWGMDTYDLMQIRNILPPEKVEPPKIKLHQNHMEIANCSPDIFRCTLNKIPESSSLLQKSRLPLGILIHPFKDLSHLPVVQCNTIVRCRACRTYINPFVYFVDHRRWKCNLCFRVNELPEDFQFDPVTKTYGDPSRRPEIKSSTIEFIAPSEYMLRPPQPAVYLFVLEVSRAAAESGYLRVVCETLLEELDRLPGDARTQIGFITFDSALHFYSLAENLSQPHMMVVGDIDDVFLPCPDNLLVNLPESRMLVKELLAQLPSKFVGNTETGSALGAALQASFKLMAATGGRVTVFQVTLPSTGPGSLQARGSGNAKDSSPLLNPATDFYKRLALDCSGQQIAVDLFLLNSQYADLASLSGISRYSGGCVQHFPDFNGASALHSEALERSFRRYLTRKIGFEAVMRVRCTRGLAIHTFHGNFFVRSTDLLSLPNVNPDAGFGMQVSIEESLSDMQNVCFQAALLYTSSKGERRIRVHTLCLPIAANVNDILNSADQQCIIGLLAKMAVDRSQMSSLTDARDAFINVAVDVLSTYRSTQSGPSSGLLAPHSLRLLPLYIVAVLKYAAFRSGQSVRVDDRLFAMCQMKSLPLGALLQSIYPDLYPVHYLTDEGAIEVEGRSIPQPPRLHLSSERLDSRGLFLLDSGEQMLLYVGRNIAPSICEAVLGVAAFEAIPDNMLELPELETPESERLRNFVTYLQTEKPFPPTLQVIREDSKYRGRFIQYLLEDRSESALSYYEFLQHLKSQVK